MFGVGPTELVVIVALALIILGPRKLPEFGRTVGKAVREFRSVADDLKRDTRVRFDEPTRPGRYQQVEPWDVDPIAATREPEAHRSDVEPEQQRTDPA